MCNIIMCVCISFLYVCMFCIGEMRVYSRIIVLTVISDYAL